MQCLDLEWKGTCLLHGKWCVTHTHTLYWSYTIHDEDDGSDTLLATLIAL
jgi:hypothetical protein